MDQSPWKKHSFIPPLAQVIAWTSSNVKPDMVSYPSTMAFLQIYVVSEAGLRASPSKLHVDGLMHKKRGYSEAPQPDSEAPQPDSLLHLIL